MCIYVYIFMYMCAYIIYTICNIWYTSLSIFLWVVFSLNKYPEVELLDCVVVLFLIFLRKPHTVIHNGFMNYIPTVYEGSPLSLFSTTLVFLFLKRKGETIVTISLWF